MSMIIVPMAPMYVKKEDAREYLAKTHKGIAFVALIDSLFIFGMEKGFDYAFKARGLSFFPAYSLQTMAIFGYCLLALGFSLKLFMANPDFDAMNKRIKAYKTSDMVKTNLIIGDYYPKLTLLLFIGLVLVLVFAIVLPMYTTISKMSL